MEVFVARQPILNQHEEVFAYELLYRNKNTNKFPNINGNQATTELIINSFINIGYDSLSEGKPCFINFTENLLHMRLPTYFKPLQLVVEIVSSVPPSRNLLLICKELKEKGFEIALDNCAIPLNHPFTYQLLEYIDYMKVDFLTTNRWTRKKYEQIATLTNTKLIAQRIEKNDDYHEAIKLGYSYFQGFLFSRPSVFSACVHAMKSGIPKLAFTRARMSESLVIRCGGNEELSTRAFQLGMFSTLHTIKNNVTTGSLCRMILFNTIKKNHPELNDILDLIMAIEKVEWKTIRWKSKKLGISELEIFRIYAETQNWYADMVRSDEILI